MVRDDHRYIYGIYISTIDIFMEFGNFKKCLLVLHVLSGHNSVLAFDNALEAK